MAVAKFVGIWLQKQFPVLEGDGVAIPVKIVFFAALVLAVTIVSGLVPALRAVLYADQQVPAVINLDQSKPRRSKSSLKFVKK